MAKERESGLTFSEGRGLRAKTCSAAALADAEQGLAPIVCIHG